jgi:ferredoxin
MYKITFPGTNFTPISLEENANLSEHLTVQNSSVLFGCRTGICGTCLVAVKGHISPPNNDEKEMLEVFAPNNTQARLACQVHLTDNIEITYLPNS